MTNYRTSCWYCHKSDMENMGGYVLCRQCGATWNEIPRPRPFNLVLAGFTTDEPPTKKYESTRYRPRKRKLSAGKGKENVKEEI